jgi:hypothetical protein
MPNPDAEQLRRLALKLIVEQIPPLEGVQHCRFERIEKTSGSYCASREGTPHRSASGCSHENLDIGFSFVHSGSTQSR